MLSVFYGDMPEAIYNPVVFFKNSYTDEWIMDELSIRMIRDVDKSEVIGPRVIDSPVLGKIPPLGLSGGVKTLILVLFEPEKVFNVSTCGDNCSKWLLRIAADQDRTVNLRHIMDFGDGSFDIKILNTNQVVHSMAELVMIAGDGTSRHTFQLADGALGMRRRAHGTKHQYGNYLFHSPKYSKTAPLGEVILK